jgi:hypothetical protein
VKRLEDEIQKACVKWFAHQYPRKIMYHCPNGGHRSKAEAGIFKALGVVPGVPDLFIPEPVGPWHGMYVELKSGDNKVTPAQEKMLRELSLRGYFCSVCRDIDSFMRVVNSYLAGEYRQSL